MSSSPYRQQQREYEEKRIAHVDKQNAALKTEMSNLQSILKVALYHDTYVDLDSKKKSPRIIPFEQKRPIRANYLPSLPSGLGKILPWKKSEYEQLYEQGEKRYKRVEREYLKAKTDHEIRMNGLRENAFEHNRKIEALKENFATRHSKTVEGYFYRVLNASCYPPTFPQKAELTYRSRSRQLDIAYDLPTFKAIPEVKVYRYVKSRDQVAQTALPQSQRRQLYASVLAQIPLRTIHEIYKADRKEAVDTIIFNGYVKTIDPSIGKPGQFCLVAVRTTRHQFLDLNLELVDPKECIKGLNGRLSRKPEDLVAVDPVEPIGNDVTPVSPPRLLDVDEEPGRANEIYHRVSTVVPEETAHDISIPARTHDAGVRGTISPKGVHFVELAKRYVDRSVTDAEPVPFQEYWPSYVSMDEAQQRWYFYWRAQLRQGNRLPTDLSYLFVHIYEVINLIGFESPQEGFRHLNEFWRYYRQLQPKLDRYLPDWIADFIVFHEVAPNALGWYSDVYKVTNVTDHDSAVEVWISSGEDFESLSSEIIFKLANYNPTKSKFYKQNAEPSQLDLAYKRALIAVDDAIRTEQGKSLFQIHQPEHTRVIRRAPFANAVHAYPRTDIDIVSVHFWCNVKPLAAALNSIVKQTDNVLREQAGYKYRVRGIQLTQICKSVIESALRTETPKQELSIDYSTVEQLAKDSEMIRARLLATEDGDREEPKTEEASADERLIEAASWLPKSADMEPAPTEANFKQLSPIDWSKLGQRKLFRAEMLGRLFTKHGTSNDKQKYGQEQAGYQHIQNTDTTNESTMESLPFNGEDTIKLATVSGFLHRPVDTPDDLLTDLAEIAHIMGKGDSERSKLIAVMMENKWECSADTIDSEFPGAFINVIIDEINGIALEEIGDILIFEEGGLWIILEEYHDEIEYIIKHPEYLKA